jgi:opacity protein-like surface antigen
MRAGGRRPGTSASDTGSRGRARRHRLRDQNLVAALAYGGGLDANLSRHLTVGADVRWLHLFDDEAGVDRFITPAGTLSAVRVGSRLSWRF